MIRAGAAIAAALAAAAILTGCGSGGESASAGAQPTAATAATVATTVTTAAPVTTVVVTTTAPKCATVTFSSNPEDTATDIRPTGLSCAEAEAFVRTVGALVGSTDSPAQVQSGGFTCNRVSVRSGDHGPPLGTFDCTNGPSRVMFSRALDAGR